MTVLVAGGAGFVGSHIVLALLDAGLDVVAYDDLSSGLASRVPHEAVLVEGDIRDGDHLADTLRDHGCTAIIHAAAPVPSGQDAPQVMAAVLGGGLTVLEAAARAGIPHLVLTSSADVYGATGEQPADEGTPLRPGTIFGRARMMTENALRTTAAEARIGVAILRAGDVSGADPAGRSGPVDKGPSDRVQRACRAALGARRRLVMPSPERGAIVRDTIHVSDLAAAHVLALRYLQGGGRSVVLNCGAGAGMSAEAIAAEVEAAAGINLNREPSDPGAIVPLTLECGRIATTLDWSPARSDLASIVRDTLAWERARAEGATNPAPDRGDLDWDDLAAVERRLDRRRDNSTGPWLRLIGARRGADDPGNRHFRRIAGKARRRMPENFEVMVKIAAGAIDRRELAFADETLRLVPFEFQGRPDVRVQTARLAFESGDFPRSLRLAEHLTSTPSPQAYGLRIASLGQLGRFREAFDLISDGLPEYRSIDWAINRLLQDYGMARQELPELDEAIETIAEAYPNRYLATKVALLTKARQFELAVDLARGLIAECRTSEVAATAVAEAYLRSGQWTQGKSALTAAMAMLPPDTPLGQEVQSALSALVAIEDFYREAPHSIPRDYAIPAAIFEFGYLRACPRPEPAPPAVLDVALAGASLEAGPAGQSLLEAHRGLLADPARRSELWLMSLDHGPGHDRQLVQAGLGADLPGLRVLPGPGEVPSPYDWLPRPVALETVRIRQALVNWRPRVLHAWQDGINLEAALAGIEAGIERIVLHSHNLQPDKPLPQLSAATLRRAYRAVLTRPEVTLVCCSRATRDAYLSWLGLAGSERFQVVHDGLDWTTQPKLEGRKVRRERLREKFRIPPGATVVGGTMRLDDRQRPLLWLETAIRAAGHDPSLYFLLAGDGKHLAAMREKAAQFGLADRIVLAGDQPNPETLLAAFDVLLHTPEFEALPIPVVQALSQAVPVVATAFGGAFECIPPGSNLDAIRLVDGAAPEAFLAAVLDMVQTRPGEAAMVEVARAVRTHFSLDRKRDDLARIYAI